MDLNLSRQELPYAVPPPAPPQAPMKALTVKLSRYLTLDDAELAYLDHLQTTTQRVARRRDLVREGQANGAVNILCAGLVARYRVLPDGRRQVLHFGLPGDLIGFPFCLGARATASACCLTDAVVAPVPLETLAVLFSRCPRIGAALFWAAAREAAISGERLVAVGRRDADERVAYFFLELIALHSIAAPQDGDCFCFPITQEVIADALGLSTPHVNRTLRKLRAGGLLAVDGQKVRVLDLRGLTMMASFDPAHFAIGPIPGL